MTGLPVEQILKFGELGQGAQQINNQSSAAISDGMYKQALKSYYDTQGRNARTNTLLDYEVAKEKNRLTAERNAAQNAGDMARVLQIGQEIDMLDRGVHPSQTGTAAARTSAAAASSRAAIAEKAEQRNIAQYLLDEEKRADGRLDTKVTQRLAQDKFNLDQLREERLKAVNADKRREVDYKIQSTLNNWLVDAADGDEFTAQTMMTSYYDYAPGETTRIPYYEEGLFSGDPKYGEFEDETGKVMTLDDMKRIAEEAGGTVDELIKLYAEQK